MGDIGKVALSKVNKIIAKSEATTYLGHVATNCDIPTLRLASGGNPMQTRTGHKAMDDITSLKLIIPRWYSTESQTGGTATIKASIEYPVGTFTQATFSGNSSILAGDKINVITDDIVVEIPTGSKFYVRIFVESTDGSLIYNDSGINSDGSDNGFESGAGVTDKTLGGAVANSTTKAFRPAGIIAYTSKVSVALLGDSIVEGTAAMKTRDSMHGLFAPSVGRKFAFTNLGKASETALSFTTNYALRVAIANYASHILCNYGVNDLVAGSTANTIMFYLNTIANMFADKIFMQSTITPMTTSTDAFATTVNQTVLASSAERIALNTKLRNYELTNGDIIIEVAQSLETDFNSGIWIPTHTSDGIHLNTIGGYQVLGKGVIPLELFNR